MKYIIMKLKITLWLLLPLSFCQEPVLMLPYGDVNVYLNSSGSFSCWYTSNDEVQSYKWLINDMYYRITEVSGYINEEDTHPTSTIAVTKFTEGFNESTIQCEAVFSDNTTRRSQVAQIRLQGILSQVGSLKSDLQENYIFYTWNQPFSLSLINEIVINYNIEVLNKTSNAYIYNNEIKSTHFNLTFSSLRPTACDDIEFTVTPTNDLGQGIPSTLQHINQEPQYEDYMLTGSSTNINFILNMSAPICKMRYASFTNLDLPIDEGFFYDISYTSMLNYNSNTFLYKINNLLLKENFMYQINLVIEYNINNISLHQNLSTHDISTVTFDTSSRNTVIRVDYTTKKVVTATGAFLTFLYCENFDCTNIDYDRSIYLALQKSMSENANKPLPNGRYLVYTFDVEADGLLITPSPTYSIFPAYNTMIIVTNGGNLPTPVNDLPCSLTNSSGTIVSNCNMTSLVISQSELPSSTLNTALLQQCQREPIIYESFEYIVVFLVTDGTGILDSSLIGRGITNNDEFECEYPTLAPSNSATSDTHISSSATASTTTKAHSNKRAFDWWWIVGISIIPVAVPIGVVLIIILVVIGKRRKQKKLMEKEHWRKRYDMYKVTKEGDKRATSSNIYVTNTSIDDK